MRTGTRIALIASLALLATDAWAGAPPVERLHEIEDRLRMLEHEDADSNPGRLAVFVGSEDEELLLRRLSVRIDDQDPVEYEYSAEESQALRAHGLHRLLSMPLAAGAHHLRVQLVGREVDARYDTPTVIATLDSRFVMSPVSTAAVLTLKGPGLLRAAKVNVSTSATLPEPQLAQALAFDAAQGAEGPASAGTYAMDIARYNAAIALLLGEDATQGEAQLDALGRSKATDSTGLTLRDLANVTVGFARLRTRRGTEAIEVFKRVRSPGPYGNAALLGLGWAYLLPRGDGAETTTSAAGPWWPQDEPDTPALRRRMPFRHASAIATRGARAEDLDNALVAWNELNGRDPLDPAVQEGMLAVPYALRHLGAAAQAQQHYLRAIERLQGAQARLDDALAQLADGRLMASLDARAANGWRRWLADLPYADATAYVRWLCESPAFVDAYDAHRAWRDAGREQDALLDRLDRLGAAGEAAPVLRSQLAAIAADIAAGASDADAAFDAVTAALLKERLERTRDYLAEARFALARLSDPAPTLASAGGR